MATAVEVCEFARTLPRSSEGIVRGRTKFRIGRIVYLSLSRDGKTMGFAFPKEWREALVASDPEKFSLPGESDMRYHWAHVRLDAIDADRCASSSRTHGLSRFRSGSRKRTPRPASTRLFRP